ncbi:MAG: HAMP domain-containing histidine kinase [Bacteroidales bacterium]|nr:HAMP domain-containing histidine kinase [Bacteroidales bacterium]
MKECKLLRVFVMILFLSQTSAFAQNNVYKINDVLYDYLVLTQNNLRTPVLGLSMLDTLLAKAKKMNDLKAQCLSLSLRVNYYHYQKNYFMAKQEFERVAPFLLYAPFREFYFIAWSLLIDEYLNLKEYTLVASELNKFKSEAKAMNCSYGIAESYRLQGDVYYMQDIYRLALSLYCKAADYARNSQLFNLSLYYRCVGNCCFHLHRWKESEEALLNSISSAVDLKQTMPGRMLLLSLYCCEDLQNPEKIDQTYFTLRWLCSLYPVTGDQMNLYNECMYYYCIYYRKDEMAANSFLNSKAAFIKPDSLTYYFKKAQSFELKDDDRQAALYYEKYNALIYQRHNREDHFLSLSFVPQLEYQKVAHEKGLLLQNNANIKLNELKSNEQLMALDAEHEYLHLLDRKRMHAILQNQLMMQSLALQQQKRKIIDQSLLADQQRETQQLQQSQAFWKILFAFTISLITLLFIIGYVVDKYRIKKRLLLEKEKAENAKRRKTLFFQNMSHEIRNPLNAIVGFNEVLNGEMADELLPHQRAEFVRIISTNCRLLQTVFNDVIDISEFENNSYKLALTDVDIYQLCRISLESIRGRQVDGVELIFHPSSDRPYLLHTDAQRLQQILTNYLTNACKYTEKGSITLSYEILTDLVRFSVTDTGRGIKPEDAEKVFERFQMLDKSKRGTGLGLHICRLIAKLMHAKVYVDKKYTGGARFVLDHPLKVFLSILAIVCFSILPVKAQKNPLHIQDHLYQYYLKMENKLTDPVGNLMADTLYAMAQKVHDVKAQGYALENKVRFCRYADNEKMLLLHFNRCKNFCLRMRLYYSLFSAWSYVVNYYLIHNRFDEALSQLIAFQNLSIQLGESDGISAYLYSAGCFYYVQQQYTTALSYFLQTFYYDDKDPHSIDIMIGQCYFNLKQYDESIRYMKKALLRSRIDVSNVIPYVFLAKSYCIKGDAANASKMISILQGLKEKCPKWIKNTHYYSALYLYYTYIERNKLKAGEELLKSGKYGNPVHLARYCMQVEAYSDAKKLYKKAVVSANEWMTSNPCPLLGSYTSNLEYGRVMKERNKIAMNNIHLAMKDAYNGRRLIALEREKTALLLRQAEKGMQQNKVKLSMQKLLFEQQQQNLLKHKKLNQHIERQKKLKNVRLHWQMVTFSLLLFSLMAVGVYLISRLRQREKRLREDTLNAQFEEHIKDRFFHNISNKIRQPLETIVSLNEQLNMNSSYEITPQQRKIMMQQLNESGNYLTEVVNTVLDVSKIESGTYKLQLENVNVYTLCKFVLKEVSENVSEGVELLFESRDMSGAEAVGCMLYTDMQRLYFVLRTYLINACQHTHKGSIKFAFEVYLDKVVFSVTDTGDGLPLSVASTIFDRKKWDVTKDDFGISLYIVRLISDLLNGKVWVDTTYTHGARFVFEHPKV